MAQIAVYTFQNIDVLAKIQNGKPSMLLFTKRNTSSEEIKTYIQQAQYILNPKNVQFDEIQCIYENKTFVEIAPIAFAGFFKVHTPTRVKICCDFNVTLHLMEVKLVFPPMETICAFKPFESVDMNNVPEQNLSFFQFNWVSGFS